MFEKLVSLLLPPSFFHWCLYSSPLIPGSIQFFTNYLLNLFLLGSYKNDSRISTRPNTNTRSTKSHLQGGAEVKSSSHMLTCGLELHQCVRIGSVGHSDRACLIINLSARRGRMYVCDENGSCYPHPANVQLCK